MQRSVELVVDDHGQVSWHEGQLELAPAIAAQIAALAPGTLIELVGDYARPNAATKILTVRRAPTAITPPLVRALGAWRNLEAFAALRGWFERDTSATGHALRAGLAAREHRLDDAREHLREALRRGVDRVAAAPLAAAWFAAQPVPLDEAEQDVLLGLVWQDPRTWAAWVDPIVLAAHLLVSGKDDPPPWQFGGPRVAPDRELVTAWLVARAEAIAQPVEGTGIAELRAMTAAERRAWLRGSQRRDERAERDAYQAVLRRHPRDSIDSPPDSADPHEVEADQPLLAWLRFHAGEPDGDPLATFAGDLVRGCRHCVSPAAARGLARAIDAVVVLSALAPELAREVTDVVYVRAALRDGLAIVRTGDTHVMLRAPCGAFGPWELVVGDAAIALAVPAAREAIARRDAQRCELILDPVVRALVTPRPAVERPSPPPPPPPAERFVMHPKFGRGRVVASRREGAETKLVIEFAGVGQKVLLERFVAPTE